MAKRRLPRSLPPDEIRTLLAVAGPRDRLALQLGFLVGMRVGEITGLAVEDLDFEGATRLIRHGKGDKDRSLPLPAGLAADLEAWLAGRRSGFVFPSPQTGKRLSTRALQLAIKRLAVRAGIPDAERPRRIHMHRLRHSFATMALRNGADIVELRELLGHSSVAVTQVYLSADAGRRRGVCERVAATMGAAGAQAQSEPRPAEPAPAAGQEAKGESAAVAPALTTSPEAKLESESPRPAAADEGAPPVPEVA
jgi:integrase